MKPFSSKLDEEIESSRIEVLVRGAQPIDAAFLPPRQLYAGPAMATSPARETCLGTKVWW